MGADERFCPALERKSDGETILEARYFEEI
jgi:hypothetical protein